MKTYVQHICHINSQTISVDGKILYSQHDCNDIAEFLKASYRHFQFDYPKFFKMDTLCKLAFLTTELLVNELEINKLSKENIGIVLGNCSSSILSDLTHQKSIQKSSMYFPSPAVFVYTLPNIMIGEMCIRHGLSNENTLFVSDNFDSELLERYTNYLINKHIIYHCICGWIDTYLDKFEAFFYFVTPQQTSALEIHNAININNLHDLNTNHHKDLSICIS